MPNDNKLLEILRNQQIELWERDRLPVVHRYKADELELDTALAKLVTGPRRAGKSTLIHSVLEGKKFAYVNFDDDNVCVVDSASLLEAMDEVYGKYDYIFFDELQNRPDWEILVNKLQRRRKKLLITGSNSKLLSSDLATALTGRHHPIELLPFSYGEYCAAANIERAWPSYLEYLHTGGFPEVVTKQVTNSTEYAKTLFDSILLRDIVKRYKVRNVHHLNGVISLLINSATSHFSGRSMERALGGVPSATTIEKYIEMAKSAYLIETLPRFHKKPKERLRADRKAYAIDNSFVVAKSQSVSPLDAKLLENAVFIELRRRGYQSGQELFFFKDPESDKEVDFIIHMGHITEELIQVSLSLENSPKTQEREFSALQKCSKLLSCTTCTIVTANEERLVEGDPDLKVVPIWKWAS